MELFHFMFTGNLIVFFLCVINYNGFFSFVILTIISLMPNINYQLKAMIIIAWNGSGELNSIFDGVVFKKVLSIFITAAILKLAHGEHIHTYIYTYNLHTLLTWQYNLIFATSFCQLSLMYL